MAKPISAKRALVIGASGQVGGAVCRALEQQGWTVIGTGLSHLQAGFRRLALGDAAGVSALIQEVEPELVVLAAYYGNVNLCEREPGKTEELNVAGTLQVAAAATEVGARLIWYSTDYVFDGKAGPYDEAATPNPVNVYGRAKLAAESALLRGHPDALVIRTTQVFSWEPESMNFAMQVWRTLSSGTPMRVASDQIGNPTLADYLGEVTVRLAEAGVTGLINVVGGDRLARSEFARRLARTFALDPDLILPVPTSEMAGEAARPLETGLRTARLEALLGTSPLSLDDSLTRVRRQWRTATHRPGGPKSVTTEAAVLKQEILEKVRAYHAVAHAQPEFIPGRSRLNYAGRVFGPEEIVNLVDASLDFWLTLGPWGDLFEQNLRRRIGVRDTVLVNSGSSANLVAVTAITAPNIPDGLRPGDEVITPAVTFPTALAPILQNQLVPVLVDCELGTYNLDPNLIEAAIGPRTRAILSPHTLGNPFDLAAARDIANRHNLFLIEDCCDALGSTFAGRQVGTFGDLSTISFFPAHHITMGEGGAVMVNRPGLARVVRSLRDWGRDCWCAPGESNSCGKRFGWCLGDMPQGYDHKFTYTHVGYNLKPTDMQAAVGVAQLERLDGFIAARRANFAHLYAGLQAFENELVLPRWDPRAEPSWFGFPITVRNGRRSELVQWLEESQIETRDMFGGQILRQPAYRNANVRVAGDLANSNVVAESTFFLGVYPGLRPEMLDYMLARFKAFFETRL
ncbi:MAG TPA: lipopolysaccharide biosynthesis protein RfbH [Candidatus Dormibacteraeota bacterium]|jgi:CDP-6-deoxy-D-xylo-4-hexulose-3-dehydrase|nr:lipopolysaccharide biosynthesis protein RfbH [Candidatus Dormibacteraeota bacterium]